MPRVLLSRQIFVWALRCERFDIIDYSSGQMFPGFLGTCFFSSLF